MAEKKYRTISVPRQQTAFAYALRFALEQIAVDCACDADSAANGGENPKFTLTTIRIFREMSRRDLPAALMQLHREACLMLGWEPMSSPDDLEDWWEDNGVLYRMNSDTLNVEVLACDGELYDDAVHSGGAQ
jgi:hypothetical protein